ncbi:hypothetical protein ABPG73_008458 [Tetrahymena malaccensis]
MSIYRTIQEVLSSSLQSHIDLEIILNHQYIADKALQDLIQSLENCINLKKFKLNIQNNSICDWGVSNLGLSISKMQNLSTLSLYLGQNDFEMSGLSILTFDNLEDVLTDLQFVQVYNTFYQQQKFLEANPSSLLHLSLSLWNGKVLNTQEKIIKLSSQLAQCTEIQNLILICGWKAYLGENIKLLFGELPEFKYLNTLMLNLAFCNIKNEGLYFLAQHLKKLLKLKKLELSLIGNQIQEIGASELFKAISTIKTIQQLEIFIGQNNIKDEGVLALSQALFHLSDSLTFLTIQLDTNQISDQGIIGLGQALGKCQNLTYLDIDLSENQISDIGISNFSKDLSQCTQIAQLTLDIYCDKITNQGYVQIDQCIAGLKNLLYLDCKMRDTDSLLQSRYFLNTTGVSVLILTIPMNQITEIGSSNLATGLSNCTLIQSLEIGLFNNQIQDEGAQVIAQSLKNFKNIVNLTLQLKQIRFQKIKKQNFFIVFKFYILSFKVYQIKYFSNKSDNQFSDKCISSFNTGISSCPLISSFQISLFNNQISDEGYLQLGQCISNLPNLFEFQFELRKNEQLLQSNELLNCNNIKVLALYLQNCQSMAQRKQHKINALKIKRLIKLEIFSW